MSNAGNSQEIFFTKFVLFSFVRVCSKTKPVAILRKTVNNTTAVGKLQT